MSENHIELALRLSLNFTMLLGNWAPIHIKPNLNRFIMDTNMTTAVKMIQILNKKHYNNLKKDHTL